MAITISGSGITSANIADGTIVNADVADVAASKLTGALPAIDGSALTNLPGGGKVLQVVTASTSASTTISTQQTWTAPSNFSGSITPSSTSSKILVIMNAGMMTYYTGRVGARVKRGSTVTRQMNVYCYGWDYGWNGTPVSITTLDSPSTTSQITYSLELYRRESPGQLIFNGNDDSLNSSNSAEIILMEISG